MPRSGLDRNGARKRDDVPFKELGEESGMLLDLDSGTYYELGGAAVAIWKALDGAAPEAIAERLIESFDVSLERARADVARFASRLARLKLVDEPAARAPAATARSGATRAPRAGRARKPYHPPTIDRKGNLKYLGQLD